MADGKANSREYNPRVTTGDFLQQPDGVKGAVGGNMSDMIASSDDIKAFKKKVSSAISDNILLIDEVKTLAKDQSYKDLITRLSKSDVLSDRLFACEWLANFAAVKQQRGDVLNTMHIPASDGLSDDAAWFAQFADAASYSPEFFKSIPFFGSPQSYFKGKLTKKSKSSPSYLDRLVRNVTWSDDDVLMCLPQLDRLSAKLDVIGLQLPDSLRMQQSRLATMVAERADLAEDAVFDDSEQAEAVLSEDGHPVEDLIRGIDMHVQKMLDSLRSSSYVTLQDVLLYREMMSMLSEPVTYAPGVALDQVLAETVKDPSVRRQLSNWESVSMQKRYLSDTLGLVQKRLNKAKHGLDYSSDFALINDFLNGDAAILDRAHVHAFCHVLSGYCAARANACRLSSSKRYYVNLQKSVDAQMSSGQCYRVDLMVLLSQLLKYESGLSRAKSIRWSKRIRAKPSFVSRLRSLRMPKVLRKRSADFLSLPSVSTWRGVNIRKLPLDQSNTIASPEQDQDMVKRKKSRD